jgi:virulence factor Mce-like protein
MIALSRNAIRAVAAVVVAAIVVALVYFVFFSGGDSRKVHAKFASGVGLYPGTPVKILGIVVGKVTHVKPQGDHVLVDMTYAKKYHVPQNAYAYLFANSLVSDRFIQLAPAYTGGPRLANDATIEQDHTTSPAELDDIYSALSDLSKALGPQGANKNGALSNLISVSAQNLQGNGKTFAESITNLSKAAQTLSKGSGDLFDTVKNLRTFTDALASSDSDIKKVQGLLASVSAQLADERGDLGAALHNLTVALHDVANFINANAKAFHDDVEGLKSFTGVLSREQASLNEILVVAPVALANLAHGYQEQTGTLGTRSNLMNLTQLNLLPKQLCDALYAVRDNPLTGNLLGDLLQPVNTECSSITGSLSALTQNLVPGGAGP